MAKRIGETLGKEDWRRRYLQGGGDGKEEEEEEEEEGEEEETALIKSSNHDLAAGEISCAYLIPTKLSPAV